MTTPLLEFCRIAGRLTAEAFNAGDWHVARQHADILRQVEALDDETALAARAAFSNAYSAARRFK